MNCKIFYCISDKGNMIRILYKSLKSLNKFIDKDNVKVCFTPPYNKKHRYKKIAKFADIIYSDNITEKFSANKNSMERYAEKFQFTEIKNQECIYLDHDTIIKKDPTELLECDFDVAFRVAGTFLKYYDIATWNQYLKKWGKTPIPMPNSGMILFKHHTHQKIKPILFDVLNDPHMVKGYNEWQNRDQIALAVSCSGLKIKWLTSNEHCYRWKNEVPLSHKPYVIHGEFDPKWFKNGAISILRFFNGMRT